MIKTDLMTRNKVYPRRRCQAAVYKKDQYRVDRRAGVPGKFSMHYTREQCKRASINQTPELNPYSLTARPWKVFNQVYLCWQHLKLYSTPGAAKPEIAGYSEYLPL